MLPECNIKEGNVLKPFQVGEKVKIRSNSNNDFAGCTGVILYVGDTVCDIKIAYKPAGSNTAETFIGVFNFNDIERIR